MEVAKAASRKVLPALAVTCLIGQAACATKPSGTLRPPSKRDFAQAEEICRAAANAPADAYVMAGRYQTATSERGLVINLLPVDRNARDRLITCSFSDWRQPPQVVRHK